MPRPSHSYPLPQPATLQGIAPMPLTEDLTLELTAMDAAFLQARPLADVDGLDGFEQRWARKQTAFAKQRRAHLRKYVFAVTSLCALVLAAGLARMFLDGMLR